MMLNLFDKCERDFEYLRQIILWTNLHLIIVIKVLIMFQVQIFT